MDDQSISEVVAELQSLLVGRTAGRIVQPGSFSLAIDFRLPDHRYLLLSADPALPRIHLIKPGRRDLEKQGNPGQFALALRKKMANSSLRSISKEEGDRIVRISFIGHDELQQPIIWSLVAQLTGRSANLFVLDSNAVITQRLRPTRVSGQQPGELFRPPATPADRVEKTETELFDLLRSHQFHSASEAADAYYNSLLTRKKFDDAAGVARMDLKKKIARQRKLLKQLQKDLTSHAGAENHKRIGDLLLANIGTAKRQGRRVTLIDYFDQTVPSIEFELDENVGLAEEAQRRFALYSRSKRAVRQINARIDKVKAELAALESQHTQLERIIEERDKDALEKLGGDESTPPAGVEIQQEKKIPGTRGYVSSDGFEILVGRAARDNDHLTFKVARPNDLWMHAADYPGSHVVIRNPNRKEIPHRTIIEAAQLAAHFSQANKDPKVDIHYTPRKFLSKPKGAAPGLVRMSRFKNITVVPRDSVKRI